MAEAKKIKVLMVCLGNICRSPMAEGILRHKVRQLGLNIETDSAGTSQWHEGEAPDRRAIGSMESRGINIADLRARPFHHSDFQEFDYIFAMDSSNFEDILQLARDDEERGKVMMIMNLVDRYENVSVPDPYFGGPMQFDRVYDMLDEATDVFLKGLERGES
jgi:protein-tyrosine phosphatase